MVIWSSSFNHSNSSDHLFNHTSITPEEYIPLLTQEWESSQNASDSFNSPLGWWGLIQSISASKNCPDGSLTQNGICSLSNGGSGGQLEVFYTQSKEFIQTPSGILVVVLASLFALVFCCLFCYIYRKQNHKKKLDEVKRRNK